MSAPHTDPFLPPNDQPVLPETRWQGPPRHDYPEDIRTPWGWLDIVFLVAASFCLMVLLGGALRLIFQAEGIPPQQIINSEREQSFFVLALQGLLYLSLLGYFYLRVRSLGATSFWRTLGWRPFPTGMIPKIYAYIGCILCGGALCFLTTVASEAYTPKGKLPIQELFQDRRTATLFILMAVLLAPLVEETIFRGYLYPVFARSFGIGWGVLITGTIFGLMHAQQLWGGWLQIGLLVVVGIVLTYTRAATKTVVASYLLHLGYNSFIALAFLIAPEGYRSLPWH